MPPRSRILKDLARFSFAALGLWLVGCAIIVAAGLRDEVGKADVALVLGSKVERDGTPSPGLRARLDKTLELYRAGYFPAVVASGGVGKEGFDEAVVMRNYLVAGGIPTERVLVDSEGVTTFASARTMRGIAQREKWKSVLVVSQYFHVPRARLALGRFGIGKVYSAHAEWFDRRDFYSVPREVLGYVAYYFRGYG